MNKEIPLSKSTIETVDAAVYEWIDKELDLFATTNKGFKKVPIIWVSSERSFSVKISKDLRDLNGTLKFPLITIERTGIDKDLAKKSYYYVNPEKISSDYEPKAGLVTIARRINPAKTANFQNADAKYWKGQKNFPKKNEKIVYQYASMPLPVYINMFYDIKIRTEYQQQMNELLSPFIKIGKAVNYHVLRYNNHLYEMFVQQSFSHGNNISEMGEEIRKFETTVPIEVLGYLLGSEGNDKLPGITIREGVTDLKITNERVIVGDSPEWKNGEYI